MVGPPSRAPPKGHFSLFYVSVWVSVRILSSHISLFSPLSSSLLILYGTIWFISIYFVSSIEHANVVTDGQDTVLMYSVIIQEMTWDLKTSSPSLLVSDRSETDTSSSSSFILILTVRHNMVYLKKNIS